MSSSNQNHGGDDAQQDINMVDNRNPHLTDMEQDILYHLGLSSGQDDLKECFGDVKFVCMGGTPHRMEMFAQYLTQELGYKIPSGLCLNDISKSSHRYSMFKVGPVLSISHGMGVPSLSILLHEVFKLLWHAGVDDAIFFRVGTCGGIATQPGTVVVTTEAVDGCLRNVHETIVLGKVVSRQTVVDQDLANHLIEIGNGHPFKVIAGKTLCTNDFYEGQARLDGAFCEYDESEKREYLDRLQQFGVANIEMESCAFTALTHHAGFRSAVVCVTLVDRLNDDQILPSKATMLAWQNRPQVIVGQYIKESIKCMTSSVGNGTAAAAAAASPTKQQLSSSPASSLSGLGYEDDLDNARAVAKSSSRVRYDSLTAIAGVRFDS